MFKDNGDMKPFASKVWLASPTMHGEELKYITEMFMKEPLPDNLRMVE